MVMYCVGHFDPRCTGTMYYRNVNELGLSCFIHFKAAVNYA